jgi:hypothetical protein
MVRVRAPAGLGAAGGVMGSVGALGGAEEVDGDAGPCPWPPHATAEGSQVWARAGGDAATSASKRESTTKSGASAAAGVASQRAGALAEREALGGRVLIEWARWQRRRGWKRRMWSAWSVWSVW